MRRGFLGGLTAVAVAVLFIGLATMGETIALPRPVPAFNQAFTNGPGAWGNCALGTSGCPDRFYETGCLVTAFSSVLAYYEITVDVPASSSWTRAARSGMDPGLLNDWLKLRGAFGKCGQDPLGSCCLEWSRLPGGVSLTFHVNRNDTGINSVSAVVIDHALRQGMPVIAGVHYGASCSGSSTQSEDCHWIILTGKVGDVYTIVDPYNPDSSSPLGVRTTLNDGSRGAYTIDRFVVVEGPIAPSASLVADFGPPVAILGAVVERSLQLFGWETPVLVFARVVDPSGQVRFAHHVTNTPLLDAEPLWPAAPTPLVPSPRDLSTQWIWSRTTLAASDVGSWHWTVWVEDPARPGVRIAETSISYVVRVPAEDGQPSSLLALLAIVILVGGIVLLVSTDVLP